MYADGDSRLIQKSCGLPCGGVDGSHIDDVQSLQLSLEREIMNSEKFFASNEMIEERYKRSQDKSQGSKNKRSGVEFEVNVDRKNIEKMAKLKEFASGKHSMKALDRDDGCAECEKFSDHSVIEFHLRLPRALDCDNDTDVCPDRPELKLKIELVEKPLECDEGVAAVVPVVNSQCLFASSSLPQPACFVSNCLPSDHLFSVVSHNKEHLRHQSNPKNLTKNKRKAKDLKVNLRDSSLNTKFRAVISPSSSPKSCIWKLDTKSYKSFELSVPALMLPHVSVYEESLLNPTYNLEFCTLSNGSSYWFTTSSDEIYIMYNNPYPVEENVVFSASLHKGKCAPPVAVHNGNHVWESSESGGRALYSCDAGYSLQGDAVVVCDMTGEWGDAPACHPIVAMSDAPDATAQTSADDAVWISSNVSQYDNKTGESEQNNVAEGEEEISHGTATPYLGSALNRTEEESYDEDYYDSDDDYYDDYTAEEYDYLPEFNATTSPPLDSPDTSSILPSVVVGSNETVEVYGNYSSVDDVADVRALLKALSIDERAIMFLIMGCCGLLVLLVLLLIIACIVVRKRRHHGRAVRKFDTFQNPIYEKTVVSVPLKGDDEDEKRPPSTPPLAIKAEMEDLSDSTVMEQ